MIIIPVKAAIAVRQKVVSFSSFPPSFRLQSLQLFLFVRINQEQLYVSIALIIKEKPHELNELNELKYSKSLVGDKVISDICLSVCLSVCLSLHLPVFCCWTF